MKLFKIRRKGTTDLFSTGGASPRWSKTGKTWSNIGHVKQHLQQVSFDKEGRRRPPRGFWQSNQVEADYHEAEVVTFEVVEVESKPAVEMLKDVRDAQAEKERKYQERIRKEREDREKAELARLKKKYPEGP